MLSQCFPTFSCSRHPYSEMKIFGGTPSCYNWYKDQGIVTIGVVTPGTSSRHPSVPRNPGWESLCKAIDGGLKCMFLARLFLLFISLGYSNVKAAWLFFPWMAFFVQGKRSTMKPPFPPPPWSICHVLFVSFYLYEFFHSFQTYILKLF